MAKNVKMSVEGDELVVRVKLTEEFGRSASGKTTIVASTGGNLPVPGHEEIKVGVNVYK
jgi:hypothetical protein